MERQRVVPLKLEDNVLTLGFPEEPSPRVITNLRVLLPSMELRSQRVDVEFFNDVVRAAAAARDFQGGGGVTIEQERSSPRLDAMLRRVAAEGASDLHLSGGQRPRWRVDGHIQEVESAVVMGPRDVWELLEPVLDPRARKQFEETNDVDFAYSVQDVARFRVNMFRDKGGIGAVMRQIPSRILTMEQLGLPPILSTLCSQPKGLVLVTGPTGSGKSTTLAAMVDLINRTRREHIVTLEDPIEFVHASQKSLVNQREIGSHTGSFHRALKAALREDPNIVLLGEMRDLETVSLALETASTGHLVFGTLHTSSAVGTVDRIIDLFPAAQQAQVRGVLADSLRGVVTQVLCRKAGGGRVAALEILVVNLAVANMIREGKITQIPSHMATNKLQGNLVLNESLASLVTSRKVEFEEALTKTLDRADLARRLNRELPSERTQAAQQMAAAAAHSMDARAKPAGG